jgi:lipopolysaccharide heptosyltransferase II
MQRILVVNVNWLGDVVFSTPFLRVLRQNYPRSFIASTIPLRCKEILEGCPYLDEVLYFDERTTHRSLYKKIQFILRLRKQRFDIAFILKPSQTRSLILKLAGIKERIGFDNPKSGWLLTVKVPPPNRVLHKIDYFLIMLEYLGFKISQRKYEVFPSDRDRAYIRGLFSQKGLVRILPLVVINPGANWYPKRWPPENFAELIKRIKERLSLNIAITGADKDRDLARRIIKESGKVVFDFSGQTSLGQLAALMQEADIVISADSGPMHIAAAVGKKVIALFGPTSARISGPYPLEKHIIIQKDVGCTIPCYKLDCQDYRCMKAITVDDVFQALKT